MSDPIPRNRSAHGRRPRRFARQRVWPGQLFRRPLRNVGPPASCPPQPRPPVRQAASPGQLFRPPGIAGPSRSPVPPLRQAPRRTQSGTEVAVGVLLLAVVTFVVWIVVLPFLPSGMSSGAMAAPPVSDHADVPAVGGNDPGPAGGQLAARPGALGLPDRGPTPAHGTPVNLTAVNRGSGLPAAVSQPGSAAPPSQPGEPADLGRRVGPPAADRVQLPDAQPAESDHVQQVPRRRPPSPPSPFPVHPGPAPSPQQLDQFAAVARQLSQFQSGRSGGAGIGQSPQQGHPNVVGNTSGGMSSLSSVRQTSLGGGGSQGGRGSSGSKGTSSSASHAK